MLLAVVRLGVSRYIQEKKIFLRPSQATELLSLISKYYSAVMHYRRREQRVKVFHTPREVGHRSIPH